MMLRPPSRTALVLTGAALMLAATTISAQQLAKATSIDTTTTRLVTDMIGKFHISQKQVDDKISADLLKRFLKELDPLKLYFLQKDVAEFQRYRDHLDDLLKVGNTDFPHQAFERYILRINEAIDQAHKQIDAQHDFSIDEGLTVDPDELQWANTPAELQDRWRRRIKYELLLQKLDNKSDAEAREHVHKRYRTLKKIAEDTEDFELLEMYLSSLSHCFDPHSSYMSPQSQEDFQIQMRLSLEGIGAALRSEDGQTVVAQIVAGGAAERDGRLKVGDKIEAVGQEEGDYVDILGMKLSRVVRLIRGPGGTQVRLRVRSETGERSEVVLNRAKIELQEEAVRGEIIPASDRVPGASGRVGVINIPSFYRDFSGAQQGLDDFRSTARDVKKVLDEFQAQGGVDAVIVDLRFNGGGALNEATDVSGLFLDAGPIVQVKGPTGRVKPEEDINKGVSFNGPLVVICNRLSASASEIFAAAIKDYGRGIVVGDTTTHGKGTVQNVMPVGNPMFKAFSNPDRGALKLTISQFYRVNGDSTQNLGVPSDVVLPSLLDHMDLGESFLDNALAFDRIQPASHIQYEMTSPQIVRSLQQASAQRLAASTDFQKTQRDVERYLTRKNRKTVSLNESVLRAERDADKAAEEATGEENPDGTKKKGPIFPKNAYNDELVHIALDYAALLSSAKTAGR